MAATINLYFDPNPELESHTSTVAALGHATASMQDVEFSVIPTAEITPALVANPGDGVVIGPGTPWENPEGYEKHNPVNFVQNWKTPMLVIHGALDYRVVDTQGISTFTALQRQGIPSKLVYFPDENHWEHNPHNSIFWHETVLDWITHWTAEQP